MTTPKARFFATPAAWRAWLAKNHGSATELLVGFHKKATGTRCISWPESVDGALCFGWIDGVRRKIDENTYSIRFTPRKRGSTWSAVNVRRVQALTEAGLMAPAGLRAFEARTSSRTATYAYEQQRQHATLPPAYEARMRARAGAWEFFQSCPPWYRRTASWWVISARQEATRERRLATLIEDSAGQRTIGPLRRKGDATER